MNKKMLIKTLTGLAMAAIAIPCFLFGSYPMAVLLGIIMLLISHEISNLFKKENTWVMAALCFAALVVLTMTGLDRFAATSACWLIVLFILELVDETTTMDAVAYTYAITMLVAFALRGIASMYNAPGENGFLTMLYVGLACFLCDTGAYFFGVFMGKHKLIPRVSPNKTWEGAIGGFATGCVCSMAYAFAFLKYMPREFIVIASILLPIAAQVGDLGFSSIKRHFGIKDFGNLIPGHGGVLDRVDSIIFCLGVFQALRLMMRF